MRIKWYERRIVRMGASFDKEQNLGHVYEEVEVTGDVIEQYRTIWGVPKFLVALDDGSLKTICANECRVIRENGNLDRKSVV